MEKTFTESEIRDAVMKFPGGCDDGKRRWLEDLGISSSERQTITYTVTLSGRRTNGYELPWNTSMSHIIRAGLSEEGWADENQLDDWEIVVNGYPGRPEGRSILRKEQ